MKKKFQDFGNWDNYSDVFTISNRIELKGQLNWIELKLSEVEKFILQEKNILLVLTFILSLRSSYYEKIPIY